MTNTTKEKLLVIWAYLVEVVAAVLLYILARSAFRNFEIVALVRKTSGQWATAFGLAVAVSVGLWGVFLQLLTTDFGAELRSRRAATVFSSALAYSTFVFFCAAIAFLLVPVADGELLTSGATLIGIYGLINFVTLMRNVNRFVRLYQDFKSHKQHGGENK